MNSIKRGITLFLILLILTFSTSCQKKVEAPKEEPLKKPSESFLNYGDTNETIVELNKVNSSVWVHTSYYEEKGVLVPSNGLIVVTDNGLVLIDTTRTEKQMESLDKLVHEAFNGSFKEAIITHAHPDRLGGASFLIKHKIPIQSLGVVAKTAEQKGFVVPDQVGTEDLANLTIDGTDFEIYYPGEAHSQDNTIVWLPKEKVLYAGNLTAASGANSLGDTADSNLDNWPKVIESIQEKYKEIHVVIPALGQWGDASLLDYTLELLDE